MNIFHRSVNFVFWQVCCPILLMVNVRNYAFAADDDDDDDKDNGKDDDDDDDDDGKDDSGVRDMLLVSGDYH